MIYRAATNPADGVDSILAAATARAADGVDSIMAAATARAAARSILVRRSGSGLLALARTCTSLRQSAPGTDVARHVSHQGAGSRRIGSVPTGLDLEA